MPAEAAVVNVHARNPLQVVGVDEFYKVILEHWGRFLPDLSTRLVVQVVDLTADPPPGTTVKREIPDIIKIEDEDDADLERVEFKTLPMSDLSLEEINQRIAYLRHRYLLI